MLPKVLSRLEDREMVNKYEKLNLVDYSKPYLVKKKNHSSIKYFYKGADYYLSFNFARYKKFNTRIFKESNADVWGLSKVFQVDLSNNSRFNQLVRAGEWNTAILVKGANDHVGGVHGDEIMQKSYFLLDGHKHEVGFKFEGQFNELEYIQESNIYFENTGKILAKRIQKIKFDGKNIYSSQKIEFQEKAVLQRAWITMLPVSRAYNSRNITEVFEYNSHKIHVANKNFEKIFFPLKENEIIKIYGKQSKFSASILFTNLRGLPDPSVFVSNAARYNKIYVSAFPQMNVDYTTSPGEIWETNAVYSFGMDATK